MRIGFYATLFLSTALVRAAPSPEDPSLINNLEQAADDLFSINIESILSVATPAAASFLNEATAAIGSILVSHTDLAAEATSILAKAESIIVPEATRIAGEVQSVISTNDARDATIARPLTMGAAAVVSSMLLGAYAVL